MGNGIYESILNTNNDNNDDEFIPSSINENSFMYQEKNNSLFYDNDYNPHLFDKDLRNLDVFTNEFSSNKENSFLNINDDESIDNNKVLYSTRQTKTKTLPTKKGIFEIVRSKQFGVKKGRRSSKSFILNKIKHGKNTIDNIIGKIKRYFIKSVLNYINKKYKEYLIQKKMKSNDLLKKINPKISLAYNNKENKPFLSMTIYEIFYRDLSDKYNKSNKDFNRKQLTLLYKKNEAKEVIDIMNKTVKEMYEKYISNEIPDFNLKNDLIKIEEKNGIDYKNLFEAKAEKFIYIINRNGKKFKKLNQ
jgi:hypothetical protein